MTVWKLQIPHVTLTNMIIKYSLKASKPFNGTFGVYKFCLISFQCSFSLFFIILCLWHASKFWFFQLAIIWLSKNWNRYYCRNTAKYFLLSQVYINSNPKNGKILFKKPPTYCPVNMPQRTINESQIYHLI
jgi:hypothetical protein